MREPGAAADPVLAVRDLTAGYVRDLPILHGVDLTAHAGTVTAIIGPNGAGKSTFVKAIAGLVRVTSGTVRHAGRDVTNIRPDLLADHGIAYVPQTDNIFRTLTIRENLDLALRRAGDGRAAIRDRLMVQFPALAAKQKEKAGGLSGGQRQFLALANALATEPRTLILDEPSAGLAPKAAQEVLEMVRALTETGVTILLVEQNVRDALRLSDHCYILAEGQNRADGRASDLREDPVVADIYLGRAARADA
jgi:ABC-type branched-subunit amino acid transport system ATPase component